MKYKYVKIIYKRGKMVGCKTVSLTEREILSRYPVVLDKEKTLKKWLLKNEGWTV